MKIRYVLCFLCTFFLVTKVFALDFNIQSNNAVLYHDDIMYEKNASEKVQIASLTKIMTAIVALENIENLDKKVKLTNNDFVGLLEANLVTAGFKAGQKVKYKDLLYGLLLPSGAECAKALSRLVAGSEEKFINLMNEKAKTLKLENTHFSNAIGLDDKNNYSNAEDLLKLFKYALENATFKEIITTKTYTVNNLTFKSIALKSENKYILGGKTGTTDGAGLCLASLANIAGEEFILITTGAPYDKKGAHHLEDAALVYNYLAKNYSRQIIVNKNDNILTLKTLYAKNDNVKFYADKDITAYLPNNYDKEKIEYKYNGIEIITTDLKKGNKLGILKIYYDNNLLSSIEITLKENQKFSLFKYLMAHKDIVVIGFIILILTITVIKIIFKRKV